MSLYNNDIYVYIYCFVFLEWASKKTGRSACMHRDNFTTFFSRERWRWFIKLTISSALMFDNHWDKLFELKGDGVSEIFYPSKAQIMFRKWDL